MQKNVNYRKECPNATSMCPAPDQNIPVQSYSPFTMVTLTVTVSYTVPTSSLVTILKEHAEAKKMNHKLIEKSMWHNQNKMMLCSQG